MARAGAGKKRRVPGFSRVNTSRRVYIYLIRLSFRGAFSLPRQRGPGGGLRMRGRNMAKEKKTACPACGKKNAGERVCCGKCGCLLPAIAPWLDDGGQTDLRSVGGLEARRAVVRRAFSQNSAGRHLLLTACVTSEGRWLSDPTQREMWFVFSDATFLVLFQNWRKAPGDAYVYREERGRVPEDVREKLEGIMDKELKGKKGEGRKGAFGADASCHEWYSADGTCVYSDERDGGPALSCLLGLKAGYAKAKEAILKGIAASPDGTAAIIGNALVYDDGLDIRYDTRRNWSSFVRDVMNDCAFRADVSGTKVTVSLA